MTLEEAITIIREIDPSAEETNSRRAETLILQAVHDGANVEFPSDNISLCVLADVAPVRHGRWSREKNYETGYEIWVNVCSACGAITPVNVSRYKYCPNCGAKMDKEKE